MRRLFKVGSDRHDIGRVTFTWHPEGNFLASAGKNGIVQITDRFGEILHEIPMSMTTPILSLSWDKDGEYLAILQEGNGVVPLWSLNSKKVIPLETSLKDPSYLEWSKTGPQLAIGTAKGNLLIYNKITKKKIPLMGKHSKTILCGAWSNGNNRLALGSDDKHITISNDVGETLLHAELRSVPHQLLFTYRRTSASDNNQTAGDNTVSAIMDGKSILLHNITDDGEDPLELTFAQRANGSGCKYGDIVNHHWMDENMLLVGFSGGTVLLVSTGLKDLGEEKFSVKFHPNNLITFAYNQFLKRCASAGDDGIRIFDVRDFKEAESDFIHRRDLEDGRISEVAWSPDGQILTVGTNNGNIYNFLAKMSALSAKYKTSVAYLSSLREASIVDVGRRNRPIDITLKLEPSMIALGSKYIAAGMNNRVYFHKISSNSSTVLEQEYISTIHDIKLNDLYCAVMTDSKALLHAIDPSLSGVHENAKIQGMKSFPLREEGSSSKITCIALTDDFLYYGTAGGTVEIFYLGEWTLLSGSELRLKNGIRAIYPNMLGTRVVVIDTLGQVFLYNPVQGGGINQSIIMFDLVPSVVVTVVWDSKDKNVVMLFDGKFIHTYVYTETSVKGSILVKLGPMIVAADGKIELQPDKVELIAGNTPLVSIDGILTCQSSAGPLSTIVHPYFDHIDDDVTSAGRSTKHPKSNEHASAGEKQLLINKFCQSLALCKLDLAWSVALVLDRRQFYLALSGKAMELLDIDLACKVYRQLGDAGKVIALQDLLNIEDKLLLSGHIALLFDNYSVAQEFFLASSSPVAALDMRRDLLQWDQALKIAEALNYVQKIPEICVKYGQQVEYRNDMDLALRMYEQALNTVDNETGNKLCPPDLEIVAMSGIARCQLRLGNIRQGLRLINDMNDTALFIECGDILEQQKQYSEAASIYLKAKQYDKVAFIYTKYLIKNDKNRIADIAPIMEEVKNDQLNSTYAKICASVGRYDEAAKAYTRAKDTDKVVEIKLRYLDQIQQAFDLVRESCSAQGAIVVAEYCQEIGDIRGAIEFLLIANKSEEAFKLAQDRNMMEAYATLQGENISSDDALKVAHYYEKAQDFGNAGRYYSMCGQYPRALKLFIQCGDRRIDDAIAVVGKSQSESLIHQLIDFLVGEKDGVPKDPNYIYRLHMALKRYEDASKTALIIAKQEQDLGNYPLAHSVITETIRNLEDASIKITLQMRQMFILLHSYMLVKVMVRHGDHLSAARLLLRVAANISKFPQTVVQILTSTVIECQRAGLKASAYEYAVMLMRPEHRSSIDVNLRRKIEAIVRRKSSNLADESAEEETPCPVSNDGTLMGCYQLESPVTRDAVPMCIITGKHMILSEWCFCPNSKYPAIYSEYLKYIEREREFAASIQAKSFESNNESNPAVNGEDDKQFAPSSPNSSLKLGSPVNKGIVVLDPVLNKPLNVEDIKLASVADALKYIQRYNNIFDEKKSTGNQQDENDGISDDGASNNGYRGDDGGSYGQNDDNDDDRNSHHPRDKHGHVNKNVENDLREMDVSTKKPYNSKGPGVVSFALRDHDNEASKASKGVDVNQSSKMNVIGMSQKVMAPNEGVSTRGPSKERGPRKKVTYDAK